MSNAKRSVKPVTCHDRTVCMSRFEGKYAALDNACPHQGGPLGRARSKTAGCVAPGTAGTFIR